jgi:hypothetical protein
MATNLIGEPAPGYAAHFDALSAWRVGLQSGKGEDFRRSMQASATRLPDSIAPSK